MNKKLLALLTALAMVFCICSTAFAADSPSEIPAESINAPYAYCSATTDKGLEDGEYMYVTANEINTNNCTEEEFEAAKTLVDNEEEVVKVLEENGVDVVENPKMVLISAGEYDAYTYRFEDDGENYNEITEDYNGQLNLTLHLGRLEADVADGDTVYVLHYAADGNWEVYECVVEDMSVTIDVESLSPIMIYKMMSDGTVTPVEPDLTDPSEEEPTDTNTTEEPTTTTTAASTTTTAAASTTKTTSTVKTSPYTGA